MPSEQNGLTTEQTELIEKLNCLTFETSQLNQAYQQWRSYVEQGNAPEWMAAAIRITFDDLLKACLKRALPAPAEVPQTFSPTQLAQLEAAASQISAMLGGESATAKPVPKLLPARAPSWPGSEMPVSPATSNGHGFTPPTSNGHGFAPPTSNGYGFPPATSNGYGFAPATSNGHAFAQQPAIHQAQQELEEERMRQLWEQALVYDTAAAQPPESLPMTEPAWPQMPAAWPEMPSAWPEMPVAISSSSTSYVFADQPAIQQNHQAEERLRHLWERALVYDATVEASPEILQPAVQQDGHAEEQRLKQLWERALVYDATVEPSPEILEPVIQESHQEEGISRQLWERALACDTTEDASSELLQPMASEYEPEMPEAMLPETPEHILPTLMGHTISEPAIRRRQHEQEEEPESEPVAIRIPAALAYLLQAFSTSRFLRAATVAIVLVAGGAFGIYLGGPQRSPRPDLLPVQNSADQTVTGAISTPMSENAAFKFDPDVVVARQGRSFVLNAVLSRGSDIASVAAQIDYDANLLQFTGVSQGKFLSRHGQQVVVAQRVDPATGVLRISAEQATGSLGLSGDGPVFALSFQAKKKGKATVSIVPGAHDSQGRRIEMTGSQVAVTVN